MSRRKALERFRGPRDADRRQAHAQAHLEQGRVLELEGRGRDPHEDHGADVVEEVDHNADGIELGAGEGGELDDEAHAAADREDDAVAPAGRAELGREDNAVEACGGVVGGFRQRVRSHIVFR